MSKKSCLLTLIVFLSLNAFSFEQIILERKSQINWKSLKTDSLLSIKKWRVNNEFKETEEIMKMVTQERNHKELVGRIIECVGICKNDKGTSIWNVGYLSKIVEQDEITTMEDSYAWIFLVDGTIVRLSPNSSVSFNEINIGTDEIFVHARINNGNVLWLARSGKQYKSSLMRETDALFLPLSMYQANPVSEKSAMDEDNLYELLTVNESEKKYKRLNVMIDENNEFTNNRMSYAFLVTPNGTISGKQLAVEFIVLFGNGAYLKNRDMSYALKGWIGRWPKFYFRGYKNEKIAKLQVGSWYKVSQDGRAFSKYSEGEKRFKVGELPTKRIPTILTAREIMLKKYSKEVFDTKASPKKMRLQYKYWLWSGFKQGENSDLLKRMWFLEEYTRRVETTNIGVLNGLIENLQMKNAPNVKTEYDSSFYRKAIHKYSVKNEINYWNMAKGDRKVLNSTKRLFWRMVNER